MSVYFSKKQQPSRNVFSLSLLIAERLALERLRWNFRFWFLLLLWPRIIFREVFTQRCVHCSPSVAKHALCSLEVITRRSSIITRILAMSVPSINQTRMSARVSSELQRVVMWWNFKWVSLCFSLLCSLVGFRSESMKTERSLMRNSKHSDVVQPSLRRLWPPNGSKASQSKKRIPSRTKTLPRNCVYHQWNCIVQVRRHDRAEKFGAKCHF